MINQQAVLMEATPELAQLMRAYLNAKADAKAANETVDQLKGMLKALLEPSLNETTTEAALVDGDVKVTLKATTSRRLDTARIKSELPEVYLNYSKESVSFVLTDGLS